MIIKNVNNKHDLSKTTWNMKNIEYINTLQGFSEPWEEQP